MRGVLIVFSAFLIASFMFGSVYSLKVDTGEEIIDACALSANKIKGVSIFNDEGKTKAVRLYLELPPGWEGFVLPSVTLSPFERVYIKDVYVSPTKTLGEKTIKLVALKDGEMYTKDIKLNVTNCNVVEVKAHDKSSCMKNMNYSFEIKNSGKSDEILNVSVLGNGKLMYNSLESVKSGEKRRIELGINFEEYGEMDVEIIANSLNSFVNERKRVVLKYERCYDFSVGYENISCVGRDYYLRIKNTGTRNDGYVVTIPEINGSFEINLSANEEFNLYLNTSSLENETRVLSINVSSLKSGRWKEAIVTVSHELCRDFSIVALPKKLENTTENMVVFLRNFLKTGYEVSIFSKGLVNETIFLKPDEIKVLSIKVNRSTLEGGEVTISACSGNTCEKSFFYTRT